MDYTQTPFLFRLQKAIRYVQLYGPRRTLAKIEGQYHIKKRYDRLPMLPHPLPTHGHVGLLGCGNYAFSTIAYYLSRYQGKHILRAAMDIDLHHAASLYEAYRLAYYTSDSMQVIQDPDINLLYIASNHATHAEYAIEALKLHKCVHIEKPHVINFDQLVRLCQEMNRSLGKVHLGFNRPLSKIGCAIHAALETQPGSAMFNWFVAGHELPPDHWYYRSSEGGRVLGNLCHWTDFTLQMIPPAARFPITIRPTRWEKSDCDICVSYVFADGSMSAITFSAKGHTFEGVKERFAAHKGDVLISMDDFKTLTIESRAQKHHTELPFRDHGHQRSILDAYDLLSGAPGASIEYVWDTAELFLKTREALETNQPTTALGFHHPDNQALIRLSQ